jgi:hypothetical protein
MATKQFISLENLTTYDELLKNYVAAEDAKSIKTVAIDGNILKFYDVEEPVGSTAPKYNITLPQPDLSNFVEKVIEGSNGRAMVWNESDGGGIFFEHKNHLKSFVGVNDGDAGELAAQIYAIDTTNKKGTRINVTTEGIYYTNGATSPAFTAGDEIATKKDVQGDAASKTVYLKDESAGQSEYAKVYKLYQGSDAVDMTQNVLVGTINFPKDLFIKSASIRTVTVEDEPYPGAKVGDKYIDVEVQNQVDHLYIPVNDLVDVYTGGTTSEITVSIDGNNEITATINNGSIAKEKLSASVQASLDLADSSLQDEDITEVDEEDIEDLFN